MSELQLANGFEGLFQLTTAQIATTLLLALGLGLVVAITYRISVPGRVLSPAMQSSLVLLAMVTAMVMMVIGNNIARAFSLVGALAIVRFRTRLRSPWDISFVFFALATGIGCGVFAYRVAIIGTLIVGLAVLALHVIPLSGIRSENIRTVRCDVAAFEGAETALDEAMTRHFSRRWLLEARSMRFGEVHSYRYRVVVRNPNRVADLLRDIAAIEGVERVVLDAGEEEEVDS
jgi:hypothetical protein